MPSPHRIGTYSRKGIKLDARTIAGARSAEPRPIKSDRRFIIMHHHPEASRLALSSRGTGRHVSTPREKQATLSTRRLKVNCFELDGRSVRTVPPAISFDGPESNRASSVAGGPTSLSGGEPLSRCCNPGRDFNPITLSRLQVAVKSRPPPAWPSRRSRTPAGRLP